MNKPLAHIDLVPVEGGISLVLPAEVAARLDSAGTGRVVIMQDEDGSVRLEAAGSEADRQLAIGRDIINRRHHALSVLAK